MMFTGKTQSESWVCRVPDGPFRKHFKYLKHKDVVQKRETEFLEGALGHSWEDSRHGVDPVLRVLLHHARHLHFHKTSCFPSLDVEKCAELAEDAILNSHVEVNTNELVRKKFEMLGWKRWFTREDSNVEQDQE